ncbi:hypothetical protein ACWD6R_27230 [Streptomyces sp. NPDC005151]
MLDTTISGADHLAIKAALDTIAEVLTPLETRARLQHDFTPAA